MRTLRFLAFLAYFLHKPAKIRACLFYFVDTARKNSYN